MPRRKPTSEEKHKFEEERARKILALYFPEKYTQSVLSESPDIINEKMGIGVEVTSCTKQEIQAGLAWASAISGKKRQELTDASKKRIVSGKVFASELPNGMMLGAFTYWGNTHDPAKVYLAKTQVLNASHFRRFAENNLFIIAWQIDEDELDEAINYFNSGRDKHFGSSITAYATFFDKVYLFTKYQLIEFNIENRVSNVYLIKEEELAKISYATYNDIIEMKK